MRWRTEQPYPVVCGLTCAKARLPVSSIYFKPKWDAGKQRKLLVLDVSLSFGTDVHRTTSAFSVYSSINDRTTQVVCSYQQTAGMQNPISQKYTKLCLENNMPGLTYTVKSLLSALCMLSTNSKTRQYKVAQPFTVSHLSIMFHMKMHITILRH